MVSLSRSERLEPLLAGLFDSRHGSGFLPHGWEEFWGPHGRPPKVVQYDCRTGGGAARVAPEVAPLANARRASQSVLDARRKNVKNMRIITVVAVEAFWEW